MTDNAAEKCKYCELRDEWEACAYTECGVTDADQCRLCSLRGKYKECAESKCCHHESWINTVQRQQILLLTKALQAISELPGHRQDEGCDLAMGALDKCFNLRR